MINQISAKFYIISIKINLVAISVGFFNVSVNSFSYHVIKTIEQILSFTDSLEKAEYLKKKPRRKSVCTSELVSKEIVECHELSEDNETSRPARSASLENLISKDVSALKQDDAALQELIHRLVIKTERIEALQDAVGLLNERIANDIIDDSTEGDSVPTYRNENDINTREYRRDPDLGKDIYFITNVRIILP